MSNDKNPYVCIHEEKFQEHETKLEKLETRADYKEEKINQIILDNKTMDKKLDKITESIHQLQLQSAKDDFNINNRVTSLESTVRTLKWVIGIVLTIVPIIITIILILRGG